MSLFLLILRFNHPRLWEGAVVQGQLYGMNCREDQALRFYQKIVRIGHELMELCCDFISCSVKVTKNNTISLISPQRDPIAKRMVPFDSAHQTGVYTLLNEALTVGERVCGRCLERSDIGNVFASPSTTSKDTGKWTP